MIFIVHVWELKYFNGSYYPLWSTLSSNPRNSRSVDPQFSHTCYFIFINFTTSFFCSTTQIDEGTRLHYSNLQVLSTKFCLQVWQGILIKSSSARLALNLHTGAKIQRPQMHLICYSANLWQICGLFVSQSVALKMLLILAGDIELCPGPSRAICKDCLKTIRRTQRQEQCEQCNNILHLKCLIESTENRIEKLICRGCLVVPMENAEDDLLPVNYRYLNDFLRCWGMKLLHQNINGYA